MGRRCQEVEGKGRKGKAMEEKSEMCMPKGQQYDVKSTSKALY